MNLSICILFKIRKILSEFAPHNEGIKCFKTVLEVFINYYAQDNDKKFL